MLQALFWALLGRVAAGPGGARYAYIGAVVVSMAAPAVVGMTDPTVRDKWTGTYSWLLRGVLPTWLVYLGRSVAYWAFTLVEFIVCWGVVALLTGNVRTAQDMIPALPVVVLISLSMAGCGYFCAAFCVGKRAEVALYNLALYLIVVCSNAMIPHGKSAIIDAICPPRTD